VIISGTPTGGNCTDWASATTIADAGQACGTITSVATSGPISGGTVTAGAVTISCPTCNTSNATVSSIATTSPITGGTITATGTIACPTCVTGPSSTATGNIIGGIGTATNNRASPPFISAVTTNPSQAYFIAVGAGWIRNFSLYYAAAQATGAQDFAGIIRSPQSATIASFWPNMPILSGVPSATYRDTVNYFGVQQGDFLNGYFTHLTSTTGTVPTGWSAEYVLNDGGDTVGSTLPASTIALSTTNVIGLDGAGVFATTTNQQINQVPFAGTAKNMCIALQTAQSGTGSLVATLQINGSATSVVVTMAAGATAGVYCDLTHTAAITANQSIFLSVVNNATATSGGINGWTVEILPTSGTPAMIHGEIGGLLTASQTKFWEPFSNVASTTESAMRMPMPRAGSVSNVCVNVQQAVANTTSVTLMKNGSTTALTFNLANSTGVQCSTTGGPIAYAQGDTMDLQIVAGTSTQFALGGWSVNF